jgi:hypothetical protein
VKKAAPKKAAKKATPKKAAKKSVKVPSTLLSSTAPAPGVTEAPAPVALPPKPPRKPRAPKPKPVAPAIAETPSWATPEPDPSPVEGHSSGETTAIESPGDTSPDHDETR